jgi:hypothetical protein
MAHFGKKRSLGESASTALEFQADPTLPFCRRNDILHSQLSSWLVSLFVPGVFADA